MLGLLLAQPCAVLQQLEAVCDAGLSCCASPASWSLMASV